MNNTTLSALTKYFSEQAYPTAVGNLL